jgi:legumain
MNPSKGRVFNRPGGPDVYGGVAIDYRGADVTAETFLAVLRGDARAVAGRGTGRVLEAGPRDTARRGGLASGGVFWGGAAGS